MDKSFLDPTFKKFSFKQFYTERSSWGNAINIASGIATKVINDVIQGRMDLIQHNTVTVDILGKPHTLTIRAFNNHLQEGNKGSAELFFHTTNTIVLFLFTILGAETGRKYRGMDIEALNSILVKQLSTGNTSRYISFLAHEINHAIEQVKNIASRTEISTTPNDADAHRVYVNKPEEIHARIVEKCAIINSLWQRQLAAGKWLQYNRNRLIINVETKRILNSDEYIKDMHPANAQKYKKGIYTTIQFLWEQYHQWANEKNRTAKISPNDLSRIVNNQGTLKSQKPSAPVPPPLPRK